MNECQRARRAGKAVGRPAACWPPHSFAPRKEPGQFLNLGQRFSLPSGSELRPAMRIESVAAARKSIVKPPRPQRPPIGWQAAPVGRTVSRASAYVRLSSLTRVRCQAGKPNVLLAADVFCLQRAGNRDVVGAADDRAAVGEHRQLIVVDREPQEKWIADHAADAFEPRRKLVE